MSTSREGTGIDAPTPPSSTLSEYVEPVSSRRRRPAPKANPFFRFVFPLIVAALGVWVFALWREGTKAVLDSTDGATVVVVTDPAAPGYEVFVDPTPTLLVVHVDEARLVGVTVLARTLLDNGGQGVLLGAEFSVDGSVDGTLAHNWETGGIGSLESELGDLFGFGFVETVVLDHAELVALVSNVEPIAIDLLDDLVSIDDDGASAVVLAAGGQMVSAQDAALLYSWRNPGEFEANRTERQLDVWESWIQAIADSEDPVAAAVPLPEGLPPYLLAFAIGRFDLALVPAAPVVTADGTTVYTLDESGVTWLADLADQMVPLPVSPVGGSRPRVRLLDGTGDAATSAAALEVVADGAEVAILGNATEFGIPSTQVLFHRVESEAAAALLADELGARAVFSDEPDQPVDLTVVIGTDWEAP